MNKLRIQSSDDGLNYWFYNSNGKILCSGNINQSQIFLAKKQGNHNHSMIVCHYDYRITEPFETK